MRCWLLAQKRAACDPAGPRLQRVPDSLGLQLDCSPWLMRAICYSPVPYGMDPGYSEPWGDSAPPTAIEPGT